jgi:predicted N-acyltransferase
MLDEKKLKETKSRVTNYLKEGVLKTKQEKDFVEFFLTNAKKSLKTANALYDLSTDKIIQEKIGYPDFDGFLWVVNSSYYSMFYMARALLENEGIKIHSNLSIHSITFDAIINFFYLNGKLQKKIIEDLAESMEDVSEILGKQKADLLIEDYFFEKGKRSTFTYKTEKIVIEAKAKTSLERARRFQQEIIKFL